MTTNVIQQNDAVVLPFTSVELTSAINNLPPTFGRLNAAGMFPADGLASAYVEIDIENGVITALPMTSDGKPSTVAKRDNARALILKIPNISHRDDVMAGEIRSMMMLFQRTKSMATLVDVMNKRLQRRMRPKFDLTLEVMRVSALKGIIVDGAGTEIYNLFTAFGIPQNTIAFNLANAATEVSTVCGQVIALMEDNASDEVWTGVKMYVDSTFFDALISHPKVQKYYLNYMNADALANPTRIVDGSYRPRTFMFGGIYFEEYRANFTMWGGAKQQIIEAGTGYAFPIGTLDSHVTYVAPPLDVRELDGSDAAIDDLLHITQETMKHGEGVEMKGQMNALPIWRRPAMLVKCTL